MLSAPKPFSILIALSSNGPVILKAVTPISVAVKGTLKEC